MSTLFTHPKTQISASVSASLTVVVTTILTIAAEQNPPIKTWLASTFTHHWLGKSIVVSAFFMLVWAILRFLPLFGEEKQVQTSIRVLTWTSAISAVVLLGFFIWHAA